MTSDQLAECMRTNSAVVRRTMAGLRKAGFVRSEKGHGGGWSIACDFGTVTLRDVYAALGEPVLLAIGHRTENPQCLVEQSVNKALGEAFQQAEALLMKQLQGVTLSKLSADFHQRMLRHKHEHKKHKQRRTGHAV